MEFILVSSVEDALEKVKLLFSKRIDTRVMIEPFCEGIEFTVIILQTVLDRRLLILPTEVETDYEDHQIFDFRKNIYQPGRVKYHCPTHVLTMKLLNEFKFKPNNFSRFWVCEILHVLTDGFCRIGKI